MNYLKKIIFVAAILLTFFSCKEDKGNESMPLNEIKGSYEPMLNYLNEAIEEDPNDDELRYKRAKVYSNMFRYNEALKDINAALVENISNGNYYLLLAQIQFVLGNNFEAIKASEKSETLGIDNPELFILQAKVYWETGDTSRSKLYLTRIEQLMPFHSDVSLLKGQIAAYNRDTSKAINHFLLSIKNNPKNSSAYCNLITIYLNKEKEDSALLFTLKAKEFDPYNPDFYYFEGKIYQKIKLQQSSRLSYLNCLKKDSLYAPALYQLGMIYYKEGQLSEALTYLKKYTVLKNDKKEVYTSLITILNGQGKPQATIPYYERLIQLDSTNSNLKITLQKLYKDFAVLEKDTTSQTSNTAPSPLITNSDTLKKRRRTPIRKDSATTEPAVTDTL